MELSKTSFQEYIGGKRVCIVGPSPILQGRGLGAEIESYDVVIKTGMAANLDSPEYLRDYGRRIDVLYLNASTAADLLSPPVREWKVKGIKYIRLRNSEARLFSHLNAHFSVERIPAEFYSPLVDYDVPLMGSVIVKECIFYGAEEVFITGIDFNTSRGTTMQEVNLPKQGDFSEYVPGYLSPEMTKRLDNLRKYKQKDAHDHLANALYMKAEYEAGRLRMPDFVVDRMSLLIAAARGHAQPGDSTRL